MPSIPVNLSAIWYFRYLLPPRKQKTFQRITLTVYGNKPLYGIDELRESLWTWGKLGQSEGSCQVAAVGHSND
ncbi:hypothetical protein E2C01_046027 [Portunus trituberculatus]|uniref:Uncharacterized protein n=1 Tax=Portunus trituberculatus TaxID=210409 RepID=A0A5B7G3Z2_PORTR|nr:hypothetical protein [Portunus trituberculatus]